MFLLTRFQHVNILDMQERHSVRHMLAQHSGGQCRNQPPLRQAGNILGEAPRLRMGF